MAVSKESSQVLNGVSHSVDPEELFRLEIVTPQKSEFSGLVASFSAPGIEGGFQVLRDHAPLLTIITVGEVKLICEDGSESFYSTSGGFVEVSNNSVTFLADTIERKEDIDVERAKAARRRAEERLKAKDVGTDVKRANAALARATNRLRIADALQ